MRYYSEDVVDRIIDDAIQYGIDIEAGGTGERPFASHYPSVGSNWHTGNPTEDGWYLIKYECLVEGRYKGKLTYRAVHIYYDKYGIYNEDGSIGYDEVWKPIEYQIIEQNKETD